MARLRVPPQDAAAQTPDPAPGLEAARRSLHNNLLTLPVVFIMVSNHYYNTYGGTLNWAAGDNPMPVIALLALLVANRSSSAIVFRHSIIGRHQFQLVSCDSRVIDQVSELRWQLHAILLVTSCAVSRSVAFRSSTSCCNRNARSRQSASSTRPCSTSGCRTHAASRKPAMKATEAIPTMMRVNFT
jgi:uncharacterized membrane protein